MLDIALSKTGIAWNEMSYARIQIFFESPQKEDDRLEFKSYGEKPLDEWCKDLAKEICAFLNSDGGILIWGAPKELKGNGPKSCHGNLTNVPIFETDDLVRRIAGKINELPRGLQVKHLTDGTGNIYVFQIEVSEYRPHQTDDRYYMRINGESRPAPHHYIEALMKRVRYPDLRGRLNFRTISYSNAKDGFNVGWVRVDLSVIIENYSPFQNEESPRFIIYCDHGTPIKAHDKWPPPDIEPIYPAIINTSLEIVHYGEKFQRYYALGFDYDNLRSEGSQINVILKFGGRYSPLKLSHYEVDLSFLDPNSHIEDHNYEFEEGFVKENDNMLISDSDYDMNDLDWWGSIEN